MDVKKGAVLIVMACVIVPMLVGYAWPDERVDRIGWESGETHDITSSVKVSAIPTYGRDPAMIAPSWADSGEGYYETITEGFTLTSTSSQERNELFWWLDQGTSLNLDSLTNQTETDGGTLTITLTMTGSPTPPVSPFRPQVWIPTSIVTPSESTSWTNVGGLDSAKVIVEDGSMTSWSANGWTITPDTPAWDSREILIQDVLNPNYTYDITVTYSLPPEPVASLMLSLPTYALRGEIGLSLKDVGASTTTIRTTSLDLPTMQTIISSSGVISGRVLVDDATIAEIPDIGTTATIPWVRWSWDSVSDTITLSTMTGNIPNGKVFYSSTVSVSLDPINAWYATSTAESWKPNVVSYDNWVQVGTALGIVNAEIKGNQYYPDGSWQITLKQPSTIGTYLGIAGRTYYVTAGNIEIGGETVRVRDLSIFAASNGDGTSNVYANGVLVSSNVSNPSVTLGGVWNTTVILSDMDSFTYHTYEKDRGGFGLDTTGFCVVGLITSIAAFLVTMLAGRRTGGRFAILSLVAGICAAFFILMLMGEIGL